jgi:hypothetical protein
MYVSCPRVHMSYVAEWRGGGPQDLLRGFDSFRNCQLNDFFMATMVRPKAGGVFTSPFLFGTGDDFHRPRPLPSETIWHRISISGPAYRHPLNPDEIRDETGHPVRRHHSEMIIPDKKRDPARIGQRRNADHLPGHRTGRHYPSK